MTTDIKLTTADELLDMPTDGVRYELVRGELSKITPPGQYQGELTLNVAGDLRHQVRKNRLGKVYAETDYILATDPDTVRAPDVSYIHQRRLDEVGETDGFWPGAPDLAVEVISPNDRYVEVADKVAGWLGAGARMVVVVNPRNRTVAVHRSLTNVTHLTEDDTLDGGEVVAGWTMQIADIFG